MRRILYSIIILTLSFTYSSGEEITLLTEDDFKLPATVKSPSDANGAGIILIHQGGSNRGEWEFMHDKLLEDGYVILSYDIRGMGASPKNNEMGKAVDNIYNAADQAPLDLKAAIKYLEDMSSVENDRIGILGASVGGNLAVVGAATMNVKTTVSISGKTEAVLNLAGSPDIQMRSTYYISSMESDGARAAWAQEMFNRTDGPREIAISPNENGHGVTILHDSPVLQSQILTWFKTNL